MVSGVAWGLVALFLVLDMVVAWQWVRVVQEAPPALRPTARRTAILWALVTVLALVALGVNLRVR